MSENLVLHFANRDQKERFLKILESKAVLDYAVVEILEEVLETVSEELWEEFEKGAKEHSFVIPKYVSVGDEVFFAQRW